MGLQAMLVTPQYPRSKGFSKTFCTQTFVLEGDSLETPLTRQIVHETIVSYNDARANGDWGRS